MKESKIFTAYLHKDGRLEIIFTKPVSIDLSKKTIWVARRKK
jgi:hypothetical protein